MELKVDVLLTSPQERAYHTAKDIAKLQSLNGTAPMLRNCEGLRSRSLGDWEGRLAAEVRGTPSPPDAEPLGDLMQRGSLGQLLPSCYAAQLLPVPLMVEENAVWNGYYRE
ncbi:hypothetical protein WJX84_003800 [Apatococcus fuscideae]|uniref:Uncharacterized protein n=1 Tax=Apatococcus fuscideae TaxID=2026836 RepID=A0AAW1SBC5_9CHLO